MILCLEDFIIVKFLVFGIKIGFLSLFLFFVIKILGEEVCVELYSLNIIELF